jgi:uncharacterized protein YxjI
MVMPVSINITDSNGKVYTIKRPVEIWRTSSKWTLKLLSNIKIVKVVLDENHQLPDMNRENNVWEAK